MSDYDGDGIGSCAECGEYTSRGATLCHSCSTQRQIDNDPFTGWVFCPECQSGLIVQHDWRKPIYDCELCAHNWTDPDGKWIESEY